MHIPVLLHETIDGLNLKPNENVVDCTLGAGGHAAAALAKTAPDGKLLGLDVDEAALEAARSTLGAYGSRAMLVRENYRNVERVLHTQSFGPIHAALLDLGFSSLEIDDPTRGFSFRFDGPLDMRFDKTQDETAASIVNSWSADELSRIFWEYGEEKWARKIADGIVSSRREQKILTTKQLVDVIAHSVPGFYRRSKLPFPTRTFQALRIATNDELGNVRTVLPVLWNALAPGGRLAVISFHSLEDRIIKRFFLEKAAEEKAIIVSKRPITATEGEIKKNSRSRSAKLRIAIKKE
jgi:16S rRNA (cytosine1402-N4)-methyltransferase